MQSGAVAFASALFSPFLGAGQKIFLKIFQKVSVNTETFGVFRGVCEGRFSMDIERESVLEALRSIALSKPNDAVKLALRPEEVSVEHLDLWGVSEIKMGSNGSWEIKFADRVKAVALLLEYAGGGEDGMEALIRALEE
jgi:hypothetical protein